MHSRIILWSVVSALAGFLFGFDTVVISGAERTIQELWGLSPGLHGVAMAAVLYFAPRIFEMAGLGEKAALLQSIGIGITNLIFTFVGLWLIDRVGRRTLLVIGSLGYIISLGLCSWAFANGVTSIVPACLFGFIAAHAVGQGAVIWVFIAEIFPDRFRATGQAIGCGTHWVMAAALTTVFPAVVTLFPPSAVFGFFCGMMVLQLVWVLTMVPETKGVALEELATRLGT